MARQRSVGVIASGVIAILGSLATILMGFSMFLAWIAMRANPEAFRPPRNVPYPAIDVSAFVLVEGVFCLALGVFGIVCAVTLLRLKNWARISFLVFGGLLAFYVFGLLNLIANVLVPGSVARMQALMQQTAAANSGMVFYSNAIFWLGTVIGMVAACVPSGFL